MDLTVILGPMKSGKSLELVSLLSPLQYTATRHRVFQSARHVRDAGVVSRSGAALTTVKAASLACALDEELDVIGIDEVHMFALSDIDVVRALLRRGTRVVAAGIDLDHRGELFAPVRALLELGPATVTYRRAVCDRCRGFSAVYTQVLEHGEPMLRELAPSTALPDDGTYTYEARCRSCVVLPGDSAAAPPPSLERDRNTATVTTAASARP
ncbi:thymidine kinase [Dactylosporangium roseum]|uniref:Thymidine kinase n=1 Tax=Dactylosporangium roseum TaxID=47989 RepID=A0ABY5Z1C5_9ACTN|nr:thymidine kinase [Dactylosporangium roseum]UWZ35813.1 thymidine kinase [Dactylosporangium roseum]